MTDAQSPMPAVMIRYKLRPNQVERNLELLHAVYEELRSNPPEGLRWASFQLDDEVSFVDFVVGHGPPGQLSQFETFRTFRSTLDERCDEPPVMTELHEVDSLGFR